MEFKELKFRNFPFDPSKIDLKVDVSNFENQNILIVSKDFIIDDGIKRKKGLVLLLKILDWYNQEKGKKVLYVDYFEDMNQYWSEDDTLEKRARKVDVLGIGNFYVGRDDYWVALLNKRFDEGKITIIASLDKTWILGCKPQLKLLISQFSIVEV